MSNRKSILRNLLDSGGLEDECIPGQSVVELLGDNRVLIEYHRRIIEYELERIRIGVSYGVVCIAGGNLRLRHVTSRKLLITGRIDRLELHRGRHP